MSHNNNDYNCSHPEKPRNNPNCYFHPPRLDDLENFTIQNYTTLQLVEDLRIEIQKFSEDLANIFPKRLLKFTSFKLAPYWGSKGVDQITSAARILSIQRNQNFLSDIRNSRALDALRHGILLKLGYERTIRCIELLNAYLTKTISGLDFVDYLFSELGRISGDIEVTDYELSVVLGCSDSYIKILKSMITNPNKDFYGSGNKYNPYFKLSIEQLDDWIESLEFYFGENAKKCIELIETYRTVNPNLKEYSLQQHNINNPHFFSSLDNAEKMYWFGFIGHDGYLYEKGPYRIGLDLSSKDRDHLLIFAKAIGLNLDKNNIKDRIRRRIYKGELREYAISSITFSCKPMYFNLLEILTTRSKALCKDIPHTVKNLISRAKPESRDLNVNWKETNSGMLALAWLYGAYDADGTWAYPYYAGLLYSSCESYLQEISDLFEIYNEIKVEKCEGDLLKAFDGEFISKGFYSLYISPDTFNLMIQTYNKGLSRKYPKK